MTGYWPASNVDYDSTKATNICTASALQLIRRPVLPGDHILTATNSLIERAKELARADKKMEAVGVLKDAAQQLAAAGQYREAAEVYEEMALLYSELYLAEECLDAFDSATLMLIRLEGSPEIHTEIVRLNRDAGRIAVMAEEHRRAADFYLRAADFAVGDEKAELMIAAADALEELADAYEEEGDFEEAVSLLKRVGRLYYAGGDQELSDRIYRRAIRICQRWAGEAKDREDYTTAANASAEAAQILQAMGELTEAAKHMVDAGHCYERARLLEKAGNMYDAAQEVYRALRQTWARRQIMNRAALCYVMAGGKLEVTAPLVVKAADMFQEIGREMKAKWAYKYASSLFAKLVERAAEQGDMEAERNYLRFQAMCLRRWGSTEEADEIYDTVVQRYLVEAEQEAARGDKEAQAVALEEAAEVLSEAGRDAEAWAQYQRVIALYEELAKESEDAGQQDEASKYYSKAGECAQRMGDSPAAVKFHRLASERAAAAAQFYAGLEVTELATLWKRSAGIEALKTGSQDDTDRAIEYLMDAAAGFEEMGELAEAFSDYFRVFATIFEHRPAEREEVTGVVEAMERTIRRRKDAHMEAVMAVVRPLVEDNYVAAVLALQEREEELGDKLTTLRHLVEIRRPRTGRGVSKRYGR